MKTFKSISVIILFWAVSTGAAENISEIKLSRIFTPHMVLQRDIAVPIWGNAAPGAKITVAFAGQAERGGRAKFSADRHK